jgi:hypothetical protein
VSDETPPLKDELVQAFVGNAHGDLDAVQKLYEQEPNLVNSAWDWGGGDWETGLGAAAHMGNKKIAKFLLERGARIDVFAAAMLGELEIVQTIVGAYPATVEQPGPHGIPLIEHAKAGKAREVVEYLESIPVSQPVG